MKAWIIAMAAAPLLLSAPLAAQEAEAGEPQIDYGGFALLTDKVATIRSERLLSLAEFEARAREADALVLDTRSAAAFALGHIDGAVNLPFSDFTEDSLREVIGANKGRPILIYCNNNFSDNVSPVPLKKAPLALNIPTFVNLIGYGYTNVWELGETVSLRDVNWVSSLDFAQAS